MKALGQVRSMTQKCLQFMTVVIVIEKLLLKDHNGSYTYFIYFFLILNYL
jgi:hypothetical protein